MHALSSKLWACDIMWETAAAVCQTPLPTSAYGTRRNLERSDRAILKSVLGPCARMVHWQLVRYGVAIKCLLISCCVIVRLSARVGVTAGSQLTFNALNEIHIPPGHMP